MVNTPEYNSKIWDKKVEDGVIYTKAVSRETIEKSRAGEWEICVTSVRPVPRDWFSASLKGMKILCLASGGGQQGPVLAAVGADVTVVDISKKQLEQDQIVAKRDGLNIQTIQGEMSDLSFIDDETFDVIVHPVSNVFVENVLPVWKEAYRVLKDQGILISGFMNPLHYIFDDEKEDTGVLDVKHAIPYSSVSSEEDLRHFLNTNEAFEFGHTLEDQIQGQIDAGFIIAGFYEDDFGGSRLIDHYIKVMMATRAIKIAE